mmetsp:Transcript_99036/g.278346  ORF Transcript_99036/g.278346 Transcript_99036/m.278346 type:complete len:419 (+) Transcript_99036:727-1983(+)
MHRVVHHGRRLIWKAVVVVAILPAIDVDRRHELVAPVRVADLGLLPFSLQSVHQAINSLPGNILAFHDHGQNARISAAVGVRVELRAALDRAVEDDPEMLRELVSAARVDFDLDAALYLLVGELQGAFNSLEIRAGDRCVVFRAVRARDLAGTAVLPHHRDRDLVVSNLLHDVQLVLLEGEDAGQVVVHDDYCYRLVVAEAHLGERVLRGARLIKEVYVEFLVLLVGEVIHNVNLDGLDALEGFECQRALDGHVVARRLGGAVAGLVVYTASQAHVAGTPDTQGDRADALEDRLFDLGELDHHHVGRCGAEDHGHVAALVTTPARLPVRRHDRHGCDLPADADAARHLASEPGQPCEASLHNGRRHAYLLATDHGPGGRDAVLGSTLDLSAHDLQKLGHLFLCQVGAVLFADLALQLC